MTGLFIASFVVLWVIVGILSILVLLLYRQYGSMLLSSRERLSLAGLDLHARAPDVEVVLPLLDPMDAATSHIRWADVAPGIHASFVLLGSSQCAVCSALIGDKSLTNLPTHWPSVRFVWLEGGPVYESRAESLVGDWLLARSDDESAHAALDVPATPYGYVIDASGRVRGKGLVNSGADAHDLLADAGLEETSSDVSTAAISKNQ